MRKNSSASPHAALASWYCFIIGVMEQIVTRTIGSGQPQRAVKKRGTPGSDRNFSGWENPDLHLGIIRRHQHELIDPADGAFVLFNFLEHLPIGVTQESFPSFAASLLIGVDGQIRQIRILRADQRLADKDWLDAGVQKDRYFSLVEHIHLGVTKPLVGTLVNSQLVHAVLVLQRSRW